MTWTSLWWRIWMLCRIEWRAFKLRVRWNARHWRKPRPVRYPSDSLVEGYKRVARRLYPPATMPGDVACLGGLGGLVGGALSGFAAAGMARQQQAALQAANNQARDRALAQLAFRPGVPIPITNSTLRGVTIVPNYVNGVQSFTGISITSEDSCHAPEEESSREEGDEEARHREGENGEGRAAHRIRPPEGDCSSPSSRRRRSENAR